MRDWSRIQEYYYINFVILIQRVILFYTSNVQTLLYLYFFLALIGSAHLILLLPSNVSAQTNKEFVAKAVSVQGKVQVRRAHKIKWNPVQLNDVFYYGDILRVQDKSRVTLIMSNDSILRLDQNTTLSFLKHTQEKTSLLNLIKGIVHFISRIPRTLMVNTPFVNAAQEGTEFVIIVEKEQSIITVFEGIVEATNKAGKLTLTDGETAIAMAGAAPVFHVVVNPRDAVQWALYYPPILYYQITDFASASEKDWQAMVRKSITFYREGNIKNAFLSIEDVPYKIHDVRFLTYRAGLLLSVGRYDEAEKDIKRVLIQEPQNSQAIALQSIIALTQNNKDRALKLAQKAVKADLTSAPALIALSYAQQAFFDLEDALLSLEEAVEANPENSLAWARLAELWLSFGDLDESLEAAEKAVSLDPYLARTWTVLGFANLSQVNIKKSKESFKKAIELDQADPLQRLGLGLAKIREGKLREGRREIEIAISLDPNRSLIRSYLGKAYYEEKRDKLAVDQFKMAKELDPFDPTSYFYDAIQKQTTNRPGEALYDIEKSIELNDNRAVYRSKLLLDEDLAARSASRARIYEDLGFQQLALIEGWKSVNTDPASYSAHRFLADNYAALPRHEVARVSELLQSQLLQPVNITPIQPRLGQSNLAILRGAGPGDLSFNEFNPLFNRNRLALQVSGVAGGDKTLGDEAVLSGIYNKFSFSAGQFHYESDGFRENNDQEEDIYSLYGQVQISPSTNIQAEYRANVSEKGDLLLRFDPDDFFSDRRIKKRTDSMRFGFNHTLAVNSNIIGNFNFLDFDSDEIFFDNYGLKIDANSYLAELQHIFRSERFHAISGIGHFSSDPGYTNFVFEDSDIRHTNFYTYLLVTYPENVTFTLGGSVDLFDEEVKIRNQFNPDEYDNDRDQFNPKFGVTWNPIPSTTIRGALFRGLKRTLILDQTIEPTQVAGFNQFFDDANSTEFWRYGIGVDQKFSPVLYGGVEISERQLEEPFVLTSSDDGREDSRRADWDETLSRIYLYWTPFPWVALSLEPQFEKFGRVKEDTGEEGVERVETYRLPLGARFFHPSGFNIFMKATYFDQEGKFTYPDPVREFIRGDDQFWIFDASIGYRLPKRWGIITLEAKNIFDEQFKYQNMDSANPDVYPDSLFLFKFTLSF